MSDYWVAEWDQPWWLASFMQEIAGVSMAATEAEFYA